MFEFHQILAPIDFSECSEKAFKLAANLAKSYQASLDVLHVWEVPVLVPPGLLVSTAGTEQSLLELVRGRAQEQLSSFVELARQRGIPLRAARCEPGNPASLILELAGSNKYDLLVLGTHGRSGLSHLLLGSVTERVVRRSPCPVLTVRG